MAFVPDDQFSTPDISTDFFTTMSKTTLNSPKLLST
jgi:hypothetical protein